MSEPSKYGKALSALKQASSHSDKKVTAALDVPTPPPQPDPTTSAGRGGKRSDPEYAPTTFFVRKDTKRRAGRLLEDMNAKQDLSDLVEQLLAKWVPMRVLRWHRLSLLPRAHRLQTPYQRL